MDRKYVYISRQRTHDSSKGRTFTRRIPTPEVAPPPETAAQAVRSQSAAPVAYRLGAGSLSAAAVAGLTWVALALLHHQELPRSSTVSLHDLVGALQLVFASVAGAGALIALVMAYRRQRKSVTPSYGLLPPSSEKIRPWPGVACILISPVRS